MQLEPERPRFASHPNVHAGWRELKVPPVMLDALRILGDPGLDVAPPGFDPEANFYNRDPDSRTAASRLIALFAEQLDSAHVRGPSWRRRPFLIDGSWPEIWAINWRQHDSPRILSVGGRMNNGHWHDTVWREVDPADMAPWLVASAIVFCQRAIREGWRYPR